MNILIYGATSRIAHECARIWARQGHRILLLGLTDSRELPVMPPPPAACLPIGPSRAN